MHSKKLPTAMFECSDIDLTEVFIDADNNTFIRVGFAHRYPEGTNFLHSNNGWVSLKQYGYLMNAFLKDGHFHLAFKKDDTVLIYKFEKDIELVSRINIADFVDRGWRPSSIVRVIPSPEPGNLYYLLAVRWCFPINPIDFLKEILSGGHGIRYRKPYLVEVRDEKLATPRKLRYGGKIDESYVIRQVVHQEDLVHFLGFKVEEEAEWGPRKKQREPLRLHHFAYDLKKKKIIQKHTIWANDSPKVQKDKNRRFFYGLFSMDAFGDDVFVTFPWILEEGLARRSAPKLNNKFKSTVFYWQFSNGVSSDVEKIAEEFNPLVRVDAIGNVHLVWANRNGSLLHKAKRKGVWSEDKILVDNVDMTFRITYSKYIAAEFDKDNNLHVVYPSGGNLVHAKVKLD
ncbi:hypothetical protein ACFL1G_02960 [Planctomycetota bacterium]